MQILDASITALQIAKIVTADVPAPGLNIVLTSALSIATKAKEMKDTRDDCRALAERATSLALAVCQQLKGCSGDTGTKEHVAVMLHNLQDIENLMDRRLRAGKRERMLFALRHGKIAKEVKSLSTKLEDTFRAFMIQAALDNDHKMNVLTSGNIRMMQHIDDSAYIGDAICSNLASLAQRVDRSATFDGNFRLFARENIHFLGPIVDEPVRSSVKGGDGRALVQMAASQLRGRVLRYRAVVKAAGELSETPVVVYTYPDHSNRRFMEAVRFAKQACHPYIVAVLGYSRPGTPGEVSYVVTEDYCPLTEYIDPFLGTDKLRVLMRMIAEICLAVNYLEELGMPQLLPPRQNPNSGARYSLGWNELVFDRRHGGRFKWAPHHPHSFGKGDDDNKTTIPANGTERMRLVENLRSVVSGSADAVARYWFSLFSNTATADAEIPGRMWWGDWQRVKDEPEYALGAWLGTSARPSGKWHIPSPGPRTIAFDDLLSTCYSAPAVSDDSEDIYRPDFNDYYFTRRLKMSRWMDVPYPDRGEMCVRFGFGGGETGWIRYQFSCVPWDTPILFMQHIRAADYSYVASGPSRPATGVDCTQREECSSTIRDHLYYTETIVTMDALDDEPQEPPQLWFFLLNHDRDVPNTLHSPCGFWSLEKDPTSLPANLSFEYYGAYHRTRETKQVLGNLTMYTQQMFEVRTVELDADEVLALKELREAHVTGPYHARGSYDGYTADYDDGYDEDTDDYHSCANDSDDSDLEPRAISMRGTSREPSGDATDSGYHDVEESRSFEELASDETLQRVFGLTRTNGDTAGSG